MPEIANDFLPAPHSLKLGRHQCQNSRKREFLPEDLGYFIMEFPFAVLGKVINK